MAAPSYPGDSETRTEGSNAPLHVIEAGFFHSYKNKRIRRQQVELNDLREQVGKLEYQLMQLKKHRTESFRTGVCYRRTTGNRSRHQAAVWERIANNQFNDRARAEKQNKELKHSLHMQRRVAQSLHSKIEKALRDERWQTQINVLKQQLQTNYSWDISSQDEEGIFADLFTLLVKIRLEVQQHQIEDPDSLLVSWGVIFGVPKLKTCGTGLVMESHATSLLPFNVAITAAACWRIFALVPLGDNVSPDQVSSSKGDMITRSFTCSSTRYGQPVPVRGKHACRKYIDSSNDCTTIVFAGRSSPLEIAKCFEVQIQESGWIRVRRVRSENAEQPPSSIVEIHSEMLPRFQKGYTDQEQRAREIITCISESHQVINHWYTQSLSQMLVEEDWKTWNSTNENDFRSSTFSPVCDILNV